MLLFVEALVDITLLSTLPFDAIREAMPYIRPIRNPNLASEDLRALEKLPLYIAKSLTIYWNVWISVVGSRIFAYTTLSLYIYASKDSFVASSYGSAAAVVGLDRLKNRAVFTFAFMEMMMWFWVSLPFY